MEYCDGETLNELLARLDEAIDQALNEDIFVDEVNGEPRPPHAAELPLSMRSRPHAYG